MKLKSDLALDRRSLLRFGARAILITATPQLAYAAPDKLRQAQIDLFGERPITPGRVAMKLPPIAENGYSVALDIKVDSPMSEDDYVKQIAVFSPRNPRALMAQYHLTPDSGLAEVSARVRLGGTQTLQTVAEMNDGSLWSGTAETIVTLAACVVL